MASSHGRGLVHLAAALDQPSAYDAHPYTDAARLAERGGLDFLTLDDTFAHPGLDALDVLSRIASATGRIGLVPTATTPDHDPMHHVRAAVATLDRVSRGRAGWWIDASTTDHQLVAMSAASPASAGSGIRDAGFPGTSFSVQEPSVVPLSPHGCPVRLVDATDGPARRTAARYADVALVRAASAEQAAAVRDELRSLAAEFGRGPDEPRILAGLLVDLGGGEHAATPGHGGGGPRQTAQGPLYRGGPVDLAELIASWHGEGIVDGFHLTPAEPLRDLERLVNGTVALLQHRGLFRTFYPGSTLREHLGLGRPATRWAGTGRAS